MPNPNSRESQRRSILPPLVCRQNRGWLAAWLPGCRFLMFSGEGGPGQERACLQDHQAAGRCEPRVADCAWVGESEDAKGKVKAKGKVRPTAAPSRRRRQRRSNPPVAIERNALAAAPSAPSHNCFSPQGAL